MWPSENPWPAVVVCLIAAVALSIAWSQQRRIWLLLAALGALLLGGGAIALDRAVTTPAEIVAENVYGITQAFHDRDLERTRSYISNSAWDVHLLAAEGYNLVQVQDDMRVTDVQVEMLAQNTRARSRFRVNATVNFAGGSSRVATMWEAKWQPEKDGWKMIEIIALDPITKEQQGYLEVHRDRVRQLYPR
ncbi:hypothetical protein [Planctomicrobium piriforme]|uniref:DUF4440 domain-containing protein n=1 Tax=Planctomicrobium piriforme TaxID=1576369 RepID=A0A1I3SBG4_9PLAN|nr:hypothetical protein [Planctomicrobium piriforme]SFJ55332.1 hypothetical protein SAMN05421753_12367 [Planctomicrobium piriforme]